MAAGNLVEEISDNLKLVVDAVKRAGPMAWALIGLMIVLYINPAQWIWRAWFREDGYYTHGPLIPLVAGWMVLTNKDRLARLPIKPNWFGLVIIVLCSLGFLASTLCHMNPPKYFIFVFYILGLMLLLFGTKITKALLLPWAFLFFMVPLPDAVIDIFTYQLRIFVTAAAVHLVDPLGWAIVKSGNYIYYPSGETLVVDDVCAGLRSLISLLALGAIFAYLSKLNPTGKLILFILSAPVAIVTNIIRIFSLVVVAKFWGTKVASGTVHDFSGYAIFVVAFGLLYALNAILERFFPDNDDAEPTAVKSEPQQEGAG
ncbi:MAG: exosortase/archaeosortase family protein [Candidatus Omnitrophica bacterium]|nr:exosortase/archaeosortase family protein [Candidatus Omnitrophota bacterium]